mgnify:CR=1 FL=1
MSVNVATSISAAQFSALLVEREQGVGIESALREHGCSVRRASSRSAAEEALSDVDLVVILANGFQEQDTLDLVTKASEHATVLVSTDDTGLAIKAAKLGAATNVGGSIELAQAQIGQLLTMQDLKRRVARQSVAPLTSPSSGIVQRRSTPLPKEATPDALNALIAAAEGLVPMHRFQRVYVDYALRRFGGNKVHTAAALGIDRRTIQRWARARTEQPSLTDRSATSS